VTPQVANRTWQTVLDEIIRTKTGENQIRWQVMARSKWLDPIRSRLLIETQAEHFLHAGTVCAGGAGTQQQSSASCICEARVDENSVTGRL